MLFILYPCFLLCTSQWPCCVFCNNWNYNQSDFFDLDKLTDSWLILFEACRPCRGPFYALDNPSKLLCIFLFPFDLLNPALNGSSNEYSFVLMGSTTLTDSFLSFFLSNRATFWVVKFGHTSTWKANCIFALFSLFFWPVYHNLMVLLYPTLSKKGKRF